MYLTARLIHGHGLGHGHNHVHGHDHDHVHGLIALSLVMFFYGLEKKYFRVSMDL